MGAPAYMTLKWFHHYEGRREYISEKYNWFIDAPHMPLQRQSAFTVCIVSNLPGEQGDKNPSITDDIRKLAVLNAAPHN